VATFEGAWNHEYPKARGKWLDAIEKELMIWICNKFGGLLRKKIFQRTEESSNVNGSSR
jgi:hypothetical protein